MFKPSVVIHANWTYQKPLFMIDYNFIILKYSKYYFSFVTCSEFFFVVIIFILFKMFLLYLNSKDTLFFSEA